LSGRQISHHRALAHGVYKLLFPSSTLCGLMWESLAAGTRPASTEEDRFHPPRGNFSRLLWDRSRFMVHGGDAVACGDVARSGSMRRQEAHHHPEAVKEALSQGKTSAGPWIKSKEMVGEALKIGAAWAAARDARWRQVQNRCKRQNTAGRRRFERWGWCAIGRRLGSSLPSCCP